MNYCNFWSVELHLIIVCKRKLFKGVFKANKLCICEIRVFKVYLIAQWLKTPDPMAPRPGILYILSSLFMIQRKIKTLRNLIGGLMWIPNWNTNLPAGLFSVVSSLNE